MDPIIVFETMTDDGSGTDVSELLLESELFENYEYENKLTPFRKFLQSSRDEFFDAQDGLKTIKSMIKGMRTNGLNCFREETAKHLLVYLEYALVDLKKAAECNSRFANAYI